MIDQNYHFILNNCPLCDNLLIKENIRLYCLKDNKIHYDLKKIKAISDLNDYFGWIYIDDSLFIVRINLSNKKISLKSYYKKSQHKVWNGLEIEENKINFDLPNNLDDYKKIIKKIQKYVCLI